MSLSTATARAPRSRHRQRAATQLSLSAPMTATMINVILLPHSMRPLCTYTSLPCSSLISLHIARARVGLRSSYRDVSRSRFSLSHTHSLEHLLRWSTLLCCPCAMLDILLIHSHRLPPTPDSATRSRCRCTGFSVVDIH